MRKAFYNDGLSFRTLASGVPTAEGEEPILDEEPLPGEVVFEGIGIGDQVSAEQLAAAFPGYEAAVRAAAFVPLRAERDRRLTASDWTQMSDAKLSDEQKSNWLAYRQALRDLPANTTDPSNPEWPVVPA